jgi:hypothetical protein
MKQPYSSVSKPFINGFYKQCNLILSLMGLDVFINFFQERKRNKDLFLHPTEVLTWCAGAKAKEKLGGFN